MRKDLEDWLRGEAHQSLTPPAYVDDADMFALNLPVVSLSPPPYEELDFTSAISQEVPPEEETAPDVPTEEQHVADSPKEPDIEEEHEETDRSAESIPGDEPEIMLQDEVLQEEQGKNDEEDERQQDHQENWRLREPFENEAARFAERLRRIEQMRRASPLNQRSGFRESRGRFLTLCVILILVVGTGYAAYQHLQRNSYDALMQKAQEFYEKDEYQAAFDAYGQVAAKYPRRFEPFLGKGYAAEGLKRPEEAIEAYRAHIERLPANSLPAQSRVLCRIGGLYSDIGDWTGAEKSFREATVLDTTNYDAHFLLGGALEAQGKLAEAKESYQKALTRRPSSPDALKAKERLDLALAPPDDSQLRNSQRNYEAAIQNGNVALGLQNYGKASQHFSDALSIKSDDVRAMIGFADARARLGDTAGAVNYLKRALQKEPDNADIQSKLAELEEAAKKPSPRPSRRTSSPPRSFLENKKTGGAVSAARTVLDMPLSPKKESVGFSREELFYDGVNRYLKQEYSEAFDSFLACLRSREKGLLPEIALAGGTGPLWKNFPASLSIPSDMRLLAEAVRLNPEDRNLYLNLSLTGTEMGWDRKSLRKTLEDIYSHASARR